MSRSHETFDLLAHERRIDCEVARSFTVSYMSNSKWRRVFEALDRTDLYLEQMLLKKVSNQHPFRIWVPKKGSLNEAWVEEGENDCAYFYKEIEWVEFLDVHKPLGWETVPAKHKVQDSLRVIEILAGVGKIEIVRTDNGVRLYGYRA